MRMRRGRSQAAIAAEKEDDITLKGSCLCGCAMCAPFFGPSLSSIFLYRLMLLRNVSLWTHFLSYFYRIVSQGQPPRAESGGYTVSRKKKRKKKKEKKQLLV
jgi:hypothetical protein